MFTSRNQKQGSAFTLLEVMLAVAVLGMVAISIYRFVETTLTAVRVSAEKFQDNSMTESVAAFLRGQMQALPVGREGALTGEPHRFSNVPSDELRWISRAGCGLLTRHAAGEWNVTLTLKQMKGSAGYELGVRRQDVEAKGEATWLPLLTGMRSFEVRYFDSRSKEWMEKWADVGSRPALVRVKFWRDSMTAPYEIVLPLPASKLTAAAVPASPENPANPADPGNPAGPANPANPNFGIPGGVKGPKR